MFEVRVVAPRLGAPTILRPSGLFSNADVKTKNGREKESHARGMPRAKTS